MPKIKPYFDDDYVTLAFSSSNFFIPYLMVTVNSLLKNGRDDLNYDIFIFSRDVTDENKKIVLEFFSKINVSIRFVSVLDFFEKNNLYTAAHITIETYFRLIIPNILSNFDRVLFLDADLIITDDIYKLYAIDMKGYPIAATEECLYSATLNTHGEASKNYVRSRLGLKDINSYFQAGVLIFDIKLFNKHQYSEKLINMVSEFNYNIFDQDALNELFCDNYHRFGNEWNWPPMQKHMKELRYVEMMAPEIRKKYLAVDNPKIIHFADQGKPWLDPSEEMAPIWWQYARDTPLYEVVLYRMIQAENLLEKKELLNVISCQKNRRKYLKYKVLAIILWGKRKIRYKEKKLVMKRKTQAANRFIKKHGS